MNILLVEDEVSLSNAVKKILEQRGFFVDAVYDVFMEKHKDDFNFI